MNKHIKYLRYVIRHKWFVGIACFRRGIYWQGIVHDWSKLLPCEWMPYVESFYGGHDPRPDWVKAAFDAAWLHHQHANPHHWQHWVLREDSGNVKVLEMPEKYRLEMLADWEGAGRAISGRRDWVPWFRDNQDKIQLHPNTLKAIEDEIAYNKNNERIKSNLGIT